MIPKRKRLESQPRISGEPTCEPVIGFEVIPVALHVVFDDGTRCKGDRSYRNQNAVDPVPGLPVQILGPDVVVGEQKDALRHQRDVLPNERI